MIKAQFWGVRGSIPCPGPSTVKYGGNTACIELRFGEKEIPIIIDAGSGIRELGFKLMKTEMPKDGIKTRIFLTHTHWDHINGFPFFTPIFIPGTEIGVYGPVTYEEEGLDKIIGNQLSYRYFPVKQSELSANIKYYPLKECKLDLGDGITVETCYLNHPILCLGYRFTYQGKSFTTCYDTEPFRNLFPTDPLAPGYDEVAAREGEAAAQEQNAKILRFIYESDVLVFDSQYTQEEYEKSKIGWGHSTFEWVTNAAHKAKVKKVFFFHHEPLYSDEFLDSQEAKFQKLLAGRSQTQCEVAKEGQEIIIQ